MINKSIRLSGQFNVNLGTISGEAALQFFFSPYYRGSNLATISLLEAVFLLRLDSFLEGLHPSGKDTECKKNDIF